MKRIAVIPARGGSKRIPGKNVINFKGQPMISWTIQAALNSKCFDEVLVSTDSQEIANIAVSSGASVPFLRNENFDDFASASQASITALKQAEEYFQTRFDEVVQLMPNCPLRNGEHIQDALTYFLQYDIEYQISCFRFGWMNPWWSVRLSNDFFPTHIFPESKTKRSQDLDDLYCPTGAIWIARRDSLLTAKTFYGPGHRFFPMCWQAAIDIDDMEDYRMALAVDYMLSQEALRAHM